MKERYRIWETEEYEYKRAFGFIPEICCYIHKDNKKRRAVLVVPGGGRIYNSLSYRSGNCSEKIF
ncbi:MAG: hypothetical protein KHY93_02385 [Clostridiales bacterium]|nr:hypothetical protein [Clostridiales bacterium]